MRVVALLVLALLAAGCIHPAPTVQPASLTPAGAPDPTTPPPTGPSAAPPPSPTPASPNATALPANQTAAAGGNETPLPQFWNLSATASLGYLAAVSDPAGAAPPQADAAHCPKANATLPLGATKLRIDFGGDAAGPGGVGGLSLDVTAPGGKTETLTYDPTASQPPAPAALSKSYDAPAAGSWIFTARATPASAGETWTLKIQVGGASAVAPAALKLSADPGCAGAV